MQISILTLFPEMFAGPFSCSILKRAQGKKLLKIKLVNIRDFATNSHKTVDDRPYGGGVGMIMRVDVIDRAMSNVKCQISNVKFRERTVLLDPQGKTFTQKMAQKLAKFEHLILVCGHYEGVDERVRKLVDEEISIGDYILTGGELPAMVVADTVSRLIPGVLKNQEATQLESFSPYTLHPKPLGASPRGELYTLLEYPQYTRPPIYGKWKVPKIILSGNHAQIEKWRQGQARKRTQRRRPDLTPIQKG